MQLMPYSLHAHAPHSAFFKRTVCNMHGPPMSPLHLPTQSAICCGISSNHIAPSRKLCSVLGRSLRAMGKAGQMSSDTHKLCRCGRKHSANMPLSRQAWLAEDSSRLCKRRRRAALHAHRGDTHVLSMLSRKMKQQRWVQVLNKRAAESRRVQARWATFSQGIRQKPCSGLLSIKAPTAQVCDPQRPATIRLCTTSARCSQTAQLTNISSIELFLTQRLVGICTLNRPSHEHTCDLR